MQIDPWGSTLVKDYERLIKEFGLEAFDEKTLAKFPKPNSLMKRGVVFAGQGLEQIASAISAKKPFYCLTGMMPSNEKVHFGNKMIVENMKYFQERGAKTYILIADLESAATRGISLETAQKRAMDFFIPAYIAFGLDPKKTLFYFQSKNEAVKNLGFLFSKKITLNEFRAIYGQPEPSRIFAALTQAGDILFPQLKEKMPGIIPVGIDQSPHIRLTRDIARRTKNDYNFFLPSAFYVKYTPSLDGYFKMSKSKPEFNIDIPEDAESAAKKIGRAVTGGRETAEKQKKLGGIPEKCIKFELDKQHFMNDKELEDIYSKCRAGERLCGECKALTQKKVKEFMKGFNKKFSKARKQAKKVKFVK